MGNGSENLLDVLAAELPSGGGTGSGGGAGTAAKRGGNRLGYYAGKGLKTGYDHLGHELPLGLRPSVIRHAPRLLRDVTDLWLRDGAGTRAQQFIAVQTVVGSVLTGCTVRQQENVYGTNLQVLIVGGSGSGKSKVALLDRLVQRIDDELRAEYRQRREAWERDMQLYTLTLAAWKQNGGQGDCPVRPAEPLPSSLLMADDTTGAAVVRWLAGNDGRLSLLRHDELTTLIDSLSDRDHGHFADLIKKGFDNSRHVKQLRTGDEGYYIRHVGLALLISTTPDVMARFLAPVWDDGTGSRIIGHFSPSTSAFSRTPSESAMAQFDEQLHAFGDSVYELYAAVRDWHAAHPDKDIRLHVTPQQEQRFTDHFAEVMNHYVALEAVGEDAIPIVRRRAVDAKRLMLIWSLCRRLEELHRDSAGLVYLPDDGCIPVTDDDFRQVLAYTDYLINQCVFMYGLVKGEQPEPEDKPDRLLPIDHLRRLPDTFVAADARETGAVCGISRRTVYNRLQKWLGEGYIREVGSAEYTKTAKGKALGKKR